MKKNSILNLWEGSKYISGFKCARVLNIRKFSRGFWICVRMQLWKSSEYSRIPSKKVSVYQRVAQDSEYAWIWLINALWQDSEYAWWTFHTVLNKPPILNMPGFTIWQDCEYARITQGAECAWISMNMLYLISQYAWICFNNAEHNWICRHNLKKQSVKYVRTLNVFDAVHSTKSTYKLLSNHRGRRIQNTVKHLKWGVLQKEQCLGAGAQSDIFQGREVVGLSN